jgi:transcription termination factor Rho
MSETQLERSVLEAKERDELFAIADALGAKPGARAKKADLVTQILRATGIEPDEVGEPVEKPRRTRTRRTTGDAGSAAAGVTAEPDQATASAAAADAPAAAVSPVAARAGQARTRGGAPADAAPADREDPATPEGGPEEHRPETAPSAAGDSDDRSASTIATRAAVPGRPVSGSPAPRTQANGDGAPGRPGAEPNGTSSPTAPSPRVRGHVGSPATGATAPTGPTGTSGSPANSAGTSETEAPVDADGHNGQTESGGAIRPFDTEPGNRRNRRRRGRERFERGDRDLPGQAAETQYSGEPVPVTGFLDLRDEGYGFLRTRGFLSGPGDVYVSISQVRRFALRKGDYLEGAARPAGGNEKYPALLRIDTVSGLTPDEARSRPRFENLTPLFPDQKLRLEVPGDSANMTARIVDLIAPIGKGQRGMIVSPPKAGKTTILKQIAHSIEANNPDVQLIVLLVDERPEEVTDMRRSVKGEVIASTFDRPAEEHTQVAELAIERAKRMVEQGRDVVIVLDGITRLARAYNLAQPATGRIMSGGIDTGALYPPKKFFGAARNIEEGGSLTILATALVETGSRMDEVIFEEFKGTGNMELRLDRKLAERRIYPAIDVNGSSTRHEELLFDRVQLQQVWKLRRVLNALASEGSSAAGLELLMDRIKTTRTNDEFLAEVAKNASPSI